jgi:transposase
VRVKGFDSMPGRTLVAARTRLVRITTELSNQIRGFIYWLRVSRQVESTVKLLKLLNFGAIA